MVYNPPGSTAWARCTVKTNSSDSPTSSVLVGWPEAKSLAYRTARSAGPGTSVKAKPAGIDAFVTESTLKIVPSRTSSIRTS